MSDKSHRRTHKKSRLGCRNCKSRRTKCDEVHPSCGSCTKYHIVCDFNPAKVHSTFPQEPIKIPPLRRKDITEPKLSPSISTVSSPDKSSSPSSFITSPASYNPTSASEFYGAVGKFLAQNPPLQWPVFTPADRLLDLRLMNHYVQMTNLIQIKASSSPDQRTPAQEPAWPRWITTLAFGSQSLMDALLGFSAFHLRSMNPSDNKLQQISHKYMMRAINGHAAELRKGVNEKNAEELFATSTFIAVHACLGHEYLAENRGPPLHWFRAYQGSKALVMAGSQWITKSEIRSILAIERQFLENGFRSDGQVIGSHYQFLLNGLNLETQDTDTIECYRSSVALLDWVNFTGSTRHIMKFPAMVSPRFVELLAEQDPRALTIVGYFFARLKRVEDVWWLGDNVDSEFWSLMGLLPKDWLPQMDLAILELQGMSGSANQPRLHLVDGFSDQTHRGDFDGTTDNI